MGYTRSLERTWGSVRVTLARTPIVRPKAHTICYVVPINDLTEVTTIGVIDAMFPKTVTTVEGSDQCAYTLKSGPWPART